MKNMKFYSIILMVLLAAFSIFMLNCPTTTTTTTGGTTTTSTVVSSAATSSVDPSIIKVAYVVTGTTTTESIYLSLNSDSDYLVTVVDIAATDLLTKCGNNDVVLASESLASRSAGFNSLKGINKPFLLMKPWQYRAGGWDWATAGYANDTIQTNIQVTNTTHPIFTGITFVNTNEVQLISAVATTGLSYMMPASFTSVTGGTIDNIANVNLAPTYSCILEIPVGTTVGGTLIQSKFIQLAIHSDSFANITADGRKVIKNSLRYLTNKWPSSASSSASSISSSVSSSISSSDPGSSSLSSSDPGSSSSIATGTITFNISSAGAHDGKNLMAGTATPYMGGSASIISGSASVPFGYNYPYGDYQGGGFIDVDADATMDAGDFYYTGSGTITVNAPAITINTVYPTDYSQMPLSTDNTLSGLTISSGTLLPIFASGTTTYTDIVSSTTSSVTVTPTKTQHNATIAVQLNGGGYSNITSGSPSSSLSISTGSGNIIDVRVTAQNGVAQIYTITVTRPTTTYTFPWATWNTNWATILATAPVSNSTTNVILLSVATPLTFVDGLTYCSATAGNLRYRDATTAGAAGIGDGTAGIYNGVNFNGSSLNNNGALLPAIGTNYAGTITRYISIPIVSGGSQQISISYKTSNSSNGIATQKIALLSATNKTVLGFATVDTRSTTTNYSAVFNFSTAGAVADNAVLLFFTRENSTGGSIDIQQISIQ